MKQYAVVYESGMVDEEIVRADFATMSAAWAFADRKYGTKGVDKYNVQVALVLSDGELSYEY